MSQMSFDALESAYETLATAIEAPAKGRRRCS